MSLQLLQNGGCRLISYGDAIRKLAESLSYFVTRDVLYVVGGSSVILSFLYLFDRLPGSDLPTVWYVLGAGIAYVIGYAIQDGLSLTPITTTQSVIHPNRVVKKLYEWFAGPPWKDIPDHDHELATILVTEQAGERTIAELRRIISIKQWGRMSIVDTKPFMLPPARHSISVYKPQVIRIPV